MCAAHARHRSVEHDRVDLLLGAVVEGDRFRAVAGFDHIEASALERRDRELAGASVVVHHEYAAYDRGRAAAARPELVLGGTLLGNREEDAEAGALFFFTFDLHGALVGAHCPEHHRQSQATPLDPCAEEGIEHSLKRLPV